MTERLYLSDSALSACEARVCACTQDGDSYLVELDRTVFFPNKGGQPCDTGRIGDAVVTSCDERGDALLHRCDRALAVGATVQVSIDEARRFDIMQQHTGEHLLSYCAWKLFDACNVGFHCALTYSTLDLDKPLTAEQILETERMANALAAQNRAVTAQVFESEEAIADIPLRKHADGLTAPIRLVFIEGSDICTCCAPHVKHTGEIGLLKLTAALPYKGGMRLTFLCGTRALLFVQQLQTAMDGLALRFSTARETVPDAIARQSRELSDCKKELRQAYAALDGYLAAELKQQAQTVKGGTVLVASLEHIDAKRLRALALSALADKGLCVLFSEVDEQVYYVVACNKLSQDAGELAAAVNIAINGKGGGRGTLAQGSAAKPIGFAETVAQLRDYFTRVLR